MCCRNSEIATLIRQALEKVNQPAKDFASVDINVESKSDGSPVTIADTELGMMLKSILWTEGDGWLSEENDEITASDFLKPTWIVDPIDGTKEFIQGRKDWAISIGCQLNGDVIAAGVLAPAADQIFVEHRCESSLNGDWPSPADQGLSAKSRVLASRSDVKLGLWDVFPVDSFNRLEVGSIAYKLALVSAGLAEATVSLTPKNSWDIAAGVLLVEAAGGTVIDLDGNPVRFTSPRFKVNGLIAGPRQVVNDISEILELTSSKVGSSDV